MQISPLDSAQAFHSITRTRETWAIGQLLDLTVIGSDSSKSSVVQIEPGHALATVDTRLPQGLRFVARVSALTPQPVLVVAAGLPAPATTGTMAAPASAAVAALSRQHEFTTAYTSLKQAIASLSFTAPPDTNIATTLRTVLTKIVENAPALLQLATPTMLRRAVENDGSALEATLARAVSSGSVPASTSPTLPKSDWKWLTFESLGRLRALPMPQSVGSQTMLMPSTFREAPPSGVEPPPSNLQAQELKWSEANSALDGIAARITLRQLQSVEAQQQGILYGMFELPVTIAGEFDVLTLVYSRQHTVDPWHDHPLEKFLVVIPLGERRELRVELAVRGSALQVSTWSDDQALNQLAISHAEHLRTRLNACGFDVTSITAKSLAPPSLLSYLPKSRFVQQV